MELLFPVCLISQVWQKCFLFIITYEIKRKLLRYCTASCFSLKGNSSLKSKNDFSTYSCLRQFTKDFVDRIRSQVFPATCFPRQGFLRYYTMERKILKYLVTLWLGTKCWKRHSRILAHTVTCYTSFSSFIYETKETTLHRR